MEIPHSTSRCPTHLSQGKAPHSLHSCHPHGAILVECQHTGHCGESYEMGVGLLSLPVTALGAGTPNILPAGGGQTVPKRAQNCPGYGHDTSE